MSHIQIYEPCPCGSGKKLKFCCYDEYRKSGHIRISPTCIKFPVFECKILGDWKELGISNIFISRKYGDDSYIFGSYLVDFWCLGVKDVYMKVGITKRDWENIENIIKAPRPLISVSYQDARSLILGSIDYAKSFEMPSSLSWNEETSLFIEGDQPYEKKFSFGKDGVPFYVMGPYDQENYNIEKIMSKVEKADGHFVIRASAPEY